MGHVLICGMTESGKSTLGKHFVREHQARGIGTIVLDPLNDPEWAADYQTDQKDDFLAVVKQSRKCALFVDESGEQIGHYSDEMFWLATRARHYGHKSYFLSQRAQQISPTVRTQCSTLALFNVSKKDAEILADDFNRPELKEANQLRQFEFFLVNRFGPTRRFKTRPLGEGEAVDSVDRSDPEGHDVPADVSGRGGAKPRRTRARQKQSGSQVGNTGA